MENRKHKYMTLEEREEIQECLNHGMNFKEIDKRFRKDQTTISKEVNKHASIYKSWFTKSVILNS